MVLRRIQCTAMLPAMVQLVSVGELNAPMKIPPPLVNGPGAELLHTRQLVIVRGADPVVDTAAPALPGSMAEFPTKVQSVRLMAPPPCTAPPLPGGPPGLLTEF